MTGHQPFPPGLLGALRALGWALRFYVQNGWPLLGIAAIPAAARLTLALRERHQMLPAHAAERLESAAVAVLRGVLLLAIAGIDLLPNSPWWESIWPGSWTTQLTARLNGMAGRGLEWIALCFWIAIVVLVIAFAMRVLTAPSPLASALAFTGVRPSLARRRAEAIGIAVANLVTIPLTTLLIYAVIARAALSLRS